jgi:hypothetical protein
MCQVFYADYPIVTFTLLLIKFPKTNGLAYFVQNLKRFKKGFVRLPAGKRQQQQGDQIGRFLANLVVFESSFKKEEIAQEC